MPVSGRAVEAGNASCPRPDSKKQRDRAVYAPTIANWGDAKLSDYAVEELAAAIERSLNSNAQEESPRAP
jgi:hypothetical protein